MKHSCNYDILIGVAVLTRQSMTNGKCLKLLPATLRFVASIRSKRIITTLWFVAFLTIYIVIASPSTGVCNGTNTTCVGCDGIPNSGLREDACGECGGEGTTCTEITATTPRTIASSQPIVWVTGAGLNGGGRTVCGLYDTESGDLVVNSTGKYRPWLDIDPR